MKSGRDMLEPSAVVSPTRRLTVLAQDPDVGLVTEVEIPNEDILPGPRGRRIEVIDYDSTSDTFYGAHKIAPNDDFNGVTDLDRLVSNPSFHAQNVYGIVSSTLFEFERALGRYLSWGFSYGSHQLKVFPHAFLEANAFYSKQDECLAFGYFPNKRKRSESIFTCLSHDIVTHETAHALLDSLRSELIRPASRDQAAFHEGFSDIIALLKVLKSQSIIKYAIRKKLVHPNSKDQTVLVSKAETILDEPSFLNGLAAQMARGLGMMNRNALRRCIELEPDPSIYEMKRGFNDPHSRGEILVTVIMRAFLKVWKARLKEKSDPNPLAKVAAWRIEEEGAKAASHLLRLIIRSIDYLPPVNINFKDFLSAILTSDWQICPDDQPYQYRKILMETFDEYGIKPAYNRSFEPGVWGPGFDASEIKFGAANLDALHSNPEAIYKFIWDNQKPLKIAKGVFTRVNSVRPVWRVGPAGFTQRETVAEYYQLNKTATVEDLKALGVRVPDFMTPAMQVEVLSGGTLIFDEFGRLKFHIYNRLSSETQHDRLVSLWRNGSLRGNDSTNAFAKLHRDRAFGTNGDPWGGWE